MLRVAENDAARTWLAIVPLESHCFAVRLGFANPFAKPMGIVSASIQPSCGYNPVAGSIVPGTSTGHATGGAPRSKVFFDDRGQDGQRINATGTITGITLQGPAENDRGGPYPFVIDWSDWAPIRSIPCRDGGQNPLLYVYVATRAGPMATVGFVPDPFQYAASAGCRGRVPVNLRSERSGDWTDDPAGTAWGGGIPAPVGNGSQAGYSPLFCLQYMSVIPGIQGIVSGDSLMAGPGGGGAAFAGPAIRAAYDLSTLFDPICVAHMACGGAVSSVYHQSLLSNLAAIKPSFLVLQPLSRNDGMNDASLAALSARLSAAGAMAKSNFGTRTMYQGAFPIPSVDPREGGSASQVETWQAVRSDLAVRSKHGELVYDGASVIGDAAAPWRYQAGCSDDNTHPNEGGIELITPLLRTMLLEVMGQ